MTTERRPEPAPLNDLRSETGQAWTLLGPKLVSVVSQSRADLIGAVDDEAENRQVVPATFEQVLASMMGCQEGQQSPPQQVIACLMRPWLCAATHSAVVSL